MNLNAIEEISDVENSFVNDYKTDASRDSFHVNEICYGCHHGFETWHDAGDMENENEMLIQNENVEHRVFENLSKMQKSDRAHCFFLDYENSYAVGLVSEIQNELNYVDHSGLVVD